jgi:replicative DNA helicase
MTELLPPFDESVERLLLSESLIFGPVEGVEPRHFFLDAHQRLYQAICDEAECGASEGLPGVVARLRDTGRLQQVGGSSWIVSLIELPPEPEEHVRDRADWLCEYYRRRVVADAANRIAAQLRAGQIFGAEAWREFRAECERVTG